MNSNILESQQLIKIINYVLHFPSGYKFVLKIPQQITVKQITEIMRSYLALHNAHGLKSEGKALRPLYLSTLQRSIVEDIYMADFHTQQLQLAYLKATQFKVQYGLDEMKKMPNTSLCYEFIGKFASKSETTAPKYDYIARNLKDCKLYSISKFDKSYLTFQKLQSIIAMRDYYIRSNNSNHNFFGEIKNSFQTQNWVCIVSALYPFQLSKAKIQNRFVMDSILSQIARIIHILQREHIKIQNIDIDDFWMDFKLQVRYCGMRGFLSKSKAISLKQNLQGKQQENHYAFNKIMVKLMEGYFKNCNVKIIQSYIPLFHWLKNNRITNYMEFLKYFSLPQITLQYVKNKEILKALLKNYIFPLVQDLQIQEKQEFSIEYIPRTNLFSQLELKPLAKYVSCNLVNEKSICKNKNILEEVIQNISTIKKRKNEVIVCAKPTFLAKKFLKAQKNKTKSKNKSSYQSQNLNKSSKTSKSKKHQRRISQFLIDD